MAQKCSKCGFEEQDAEVRFCSECGNKLQEVVRSLEGPRCPKCGFEEKNPNAEFCSECGNVFHVKDLGLRIIKMCILIIVGVGIILGGIYAIQNYDWAYNTSKTLGIDKLFSLIVSVVSGGKANLNTESLFTRVRPGDTDVNYSINDAANNISKPSNDTSNLTASKNVPSKTNSNSTPFTSKVDIKIFNEFKNIKSNCDNGNLDESYKIISEINKLATTENLVKLSVLFDDLVNIKTQIKDLNDEIAKINDKLKYGSWGEQVTGSELRFKKIGLLHAFIVAKTNDNLYEIAKATFYPFGTYLYFGPSTTHSVLKTTNTIFKSEGMFDLHVVEEGLTTITTVNNFEQEWVLYREATNAEVEAKKKQIKSDQELQARVSELEEKIEKLKPNVQAAEYKLSNFMSQIDINKEIISILLSTKDLTQIQAIFNSGFDIEIKDNKMKTLLMHSIQNNNTEISEILVKRNANINVTYSKGITLLMKSVSNNNFELVKLLLEKKVDINAKNGDGRTALFYSINRNYFDLTKFLIENKAEVNIKDNEGKTPLYKAIKTQNKEIIELLKRNGAIE